MSLIVEDGTSKNNSESYVSVADLQTYATKWGITGLSSDTTKLEVLLRHAARAVDNLYTFIGVEASTEQAMEWPRVPTAYNNYIGTYTTYSLYSYPSSRPTVPTGIPQKLKDAQCEMALVYLTVDPMGAVDTSKVGLIEEQKQVDVLKTVKKWDSGSQSPEQVTAIRKVTILLSELIESAPGGVMVGVARG